MDTDLDFFYSVVDSNEQAAEDPDAFLYAMSDDDFETHLENIVRGSE